MEENQVHKRRVRYKGTHPRKFEEKYKEQNPEKYADTIEKSHSEGQYSGWNAHFDYGKRNSGFSGDQAGSERV